MPLVSANIDLARQEQAQGVDLLNPVTPPEVQAYFYTRKFVYRPDSTPIHHVELPADSTDASDDRNLGRTAGAYMQLRRVRTAARFRRGTGATRNWELVDTAGVRTPVRKI